MKETKHPGLNFTKPISVDDGSDYSVMPRYTERDILPAPYPFWTRHAAFTGMTYIDYDPTQITRTQATINLSDAKIAFNKTPLVIAWMRDANTDLSYSDTTAVYKFPCVVRSSAGVAQESYNSGFFNAYDQLYFVRHSVITYGVVGTKRTYIKFFVFIDEPFKNVVEGTTFTTL